MNARNAQIAIFACLICLILSLCGSARGQTSATTGAFIGTVTDSSGGAMPGAKVTASGPALMTDQTVVTDSKGEYHIPVLPPGVYRLTFDATGFQSVVNEGINISVGFTATINAAMTVSGVTQSVEVTAASPVVDATSTKVTSDLNGVQIENLPSKADYAAILEITPGVEVTKLSVGGSQAIAFAHGSRYGISGQDRSEIEGLYTTESGGGGAEYVYDDEETFNNASLSVIGNDAEMPIPGTLARFVMKSGGNTYHGHIGELFENTALETTNIDAQQLALGVTGSPTFPAVDTNRIQKLSGFEANVGGYVPELKNKLWWFAGYRYESFVINFPSLLGASQTNSLPVYAGKVSYQLTPKNSLTAFYEEGIKHENPSVTGTVVFPISAGETERWSSNERGGVVDFTSEQLAGSSGARRPLL